MNLRLGFSRLAFFMTVAATVVLYGCSKSTQETPTKPVASSAEGHITDMDVTEHVRTALQQNDRLKGFDIQVLTLKGDVRLIGALESQAQIDEAIRIARASAGAHAVHNELTLKK